MWNGHANIGKQKSLLILYMIAIHVNAIIKLWETSYKLNTQLGILSSSGFPDLKLEGLIIRLNMKYIPNDIISGKAPKIKAYQRYFLYPKSPLPHNTWLIVSKLI